MFMYSFNPYCSGRWSRTNEGDILIFPTLEVLILIVVEEGPVLVGICQNERHNAGRVLNLVVVDDGLVLRQVAMGAAAIQAVLILIVMDDGLVRKEKSITDGEHVS